MRSDDTIAAVSSPPGPAPRLIVRLSGRGAHPLLQTLCPDWQPQPARAHRALLHLGDLRLPVWVYGFAAPHSYTGEDLAEIHLPGNPLLARLLLQRLYALGARPAETGEFTARAYFNGRMDLTEAEGVAATLAASNAAEARAARQLLSGELARRLRPAMDELADTLALVEVGIDFSEEDVTFLSPQQIHQRLTRIIADLNQLLNDSARFERLSHEPRLVLAGRPNAGKSTLLNALAGHDRAVVSPQPGTTRDVLSAEAMLPRGAVRLVDVAGLDDQEPSQLGSLAEVQQHMRRHALQAIAQADGLILVIDLTDSRPPLQLPRTPDLIVGTKADLLAASNAKGEAHPMSVSALTGQGLEPLKEALDALAFGPARTADALALNARHVQAIGQALESLADARQHFAAGPELLALPLRAALDALGQILGAVTPDDLLGRIFAGFCIGK